MKLRELAERLGCDLLGDGEIDIRGVAVIEEARSGDLSFVAHPRYFPHLQTSQASAFILPTDAPACEKPSLRTPNPYLTLASALSLFFPPERVTPGVHPSAFIAKAVSLEGEVAIGPFSVLEEGVAVGQGSIIGPLVHIGRGSRIGQHCRLHPHVVIREGVVLKDRVIVHSGAVIGSDGFGYVKDQQGRYVKIPQVGGVLIEDDVEIGANVTIDRATIGWTLVKRGTKIDNLVQIAHNVVVGEDCIIVAQVGIAGSVVIGDRARLAGQVGVTDHVEIGHDVTVGAQSGVTKSLPPGVTVLGSPAIPHMDLKRIISSMGRMPKLLRDVRALEERIRRLEERVEKGC